MVKLTERVTRAAAQTLGALGPEIKKGLLEESMKQLTPGSPEERATYESKLKELNESIKDAFSTELEDKTTVGITLMPEQAAVAQGAVFAGALAGYGAVAAGTSLIELASLGQLETPAHWASRMVELLGLGTVIGASIKVPYEAAIGIPYKQWAMRSFMPNVPMLKDLFTARARFIISREDFEDLIRYQGVNPRRKLLKTSDFLGRKIEDLGDVYQRLSEAPAGYFLLSMAARSGYYNEQEYIQLLRDSNFGPEVSALAIKGFRTAFLKRHLTKFEDEAIKDYQIGDISFDDFQGRLRSIGYQEDMIEIISSFYFERKARAKKHVSLAASKSRYVAGRMTRDEFNKALTRLGYALEDRELIMDEADVKIMDLQSQEVDAARLTKGELKAALRAGVIDTDTFKGRLQNRNYSDEDIQILIDMETVAEAPRIHVPGQSLIGSEYKKGIIDETEARAELTALGYAGKDIDDIMALWDVSITPPEKATPILTLGQLNKAYKDGLLEEVNYRGELRAREYNETAIKLLADMYKPVVKPAKPPTVPELTLAQVGRLYKLEYITQPEYEAELKERKYSLGDIDRLEKLYTPKIPLVRPPVPPKIPELTLSQLSRLYKQKLISVGVYETELRERRFSELDINRLKGLYAPEEEE